MIEFTWTLVQFIVWGGLLASVCATLGLLLGCLLAAAGEADEQADRGYAAQVQRREREQEMAAACETCRIIRGASGMEAK